jgi:hypothetical protein
MIQAITDRIAARRGTRALSLHQAIPASLTILAIFLLALAPRALAQGRFVTVDEAYHWFERARLFLRAIRAGDWAGTNLVGHPGVTTMWLGSLGIVIHQTLASWQLATWPDPELLRSLLRLPVAIVTALCVTLSYPLLRRLVPTRVALLATLLWAGDPFVVAHSQLLHVDALLTSFITLSLLAALLAFRLDEEGDAGSRQLRWRLLIGSAVAGGLALLTKSPAIILAPLIGLIALVGFVRSQLSSVGGPLRLTTEHRRPITQLWMRVARPLLVWGGVALAVWVALWPAAWVDPLGAVGSIVHQAQSDGGSPHGWGNFFLGRAVADPGPLFYPVAIALRLPPWSLIGLLAAALAALRAWREGHMRKHMPLALLAIFVLLFSIMLSIAAKKFDRYILPIFPSLDIIAGAGLIWLWEILYRLRTKNKEQRTKSRLSSFVLGSLFFVLVGANLAWYHPYELAYYNPLLGGGPVAARLIPVGWGEGLEQAGAYIEAQRDGAERPVATWYRPALKPYTSAPLVPLSAALEPGKVGYAVLYIDQVQRRDEAETTDMLRAQLTPIYTVRIHGIDYAEVYQLPQPVAQPLDADFGPAIHFRGYDLDTTTATRGFLMLTVHWQARGAITNDYTLFAHILDASGMRIGGSDNPPGGAREPTSTWRPGGYVSATLQLPIRPKASPGTYWLAIGLYDPQTGARLNLGAMPQPQAPGDGENALLLGPLTLK